MRLFFAVGLILLNALAGVAQKRSAPPAGAVAPGRLAPIVVPATGALGGIYGSPARSRPLGGVALPTFPAGASPRHKTPPPAGSARYFGPVYYIPNAYESANEYQSASNYNQPAPPPDYNGAPGQPQQQPIVINQYFGNRDTTTRTDSGNTATFEQAAEAPKYFLVAYKDHSVYSALTYWVEDGTFHYVTTRNTHNQASLSLIDLDRTSALNSEKPAPDTVP